MTTEIIKFIIKDVLDESPDFDLAPDDDLLGGGLISSMGVFRIINFIEKTYNIKVQTQDMVIENFMTVDAMVAYTRSQIS